MQQDLQKFNSLVALFYCATKLVKMGQCFPVKQFAVKTEKAELQTSSAFLSVYGYSINPAA